MSLQPVLIAGQWRASQSTGTFRGENPATGEMLPTEFPVSAWADCDAALNAAAQAAENLRHTSPEKIAQFLTRFAERIEARKTELVEIAHLESALPKAPRLGDVELPRTTSQLRQAAAAALEGSWAQPTIDTKLNIRSVLEPIGPVCVFGPNNFPFAFNSAAGGDFVAAIASGNPVIAKANTSHPGTTQLLAEEAFTALTESGLPPATVQLIYRTSHDDGARLVADSRLGASAYTGSRSAGLKLKAAADAVGKPIYVELSSVNPLLILPGALAERGAKIAEEFAGSCLMGVGQFCTNPSFVVLIASDGAEKLIADVKARFEAAPTPALLSTGVFRALAASVKTLQSAGAQLVTGGQPVVAPGYRFANTLLRVSGDAFLKSPGELQTEAFGNASLFVVARDAAQVAKIIAHLEGNLTGCIYSDTNGSDDAMYNELAPRLRRNVGRLLNDKMPTGVAVSSAMNHGGPYPSTGHPGFTAVGIPAALRRFGMLACYDNVRAARLPAALQNKNPNGKMWRLIDCNWSQADVSA
ncbi:MAG: aldehyde dehydrogenase (NADP(+)) [Akkermansiaceae bacterium]|nr:aldehyde dehydrogenase (NADP(+)) [Verrucomicrobiales bacterium]